MAEGLLRMNYLKHSVAGVEMPNTTKVPETESDQVKQTSTGS